jgi:glycosyltransferase involved in cell wall biosynthesis
MKPKVSVIIPVYNVEKYLDHCINSILKNSYRNIEVIAVDDGSTDKSGKVLKDYAQKDIRMKVSINLTVE